MSVHWDGDLIRLIGDCRVEDAEPLLTLLQAHAGAAVELSGADHLHTAVVRVLLAVRPDIRGNSRDSFCREWIQPLLNPSQARPAQPNPSKVLD